MERVFSSPKKTTYRKTDFCHVISLAYVIWASNFTGPASFKFEKLVKSISQLSSLSPFREVQTLTYGALKTFRICHLYKPLHSDYIIQLIHISKQLLQNLNMSQVFWLYATKRNHLYHLQKESLQ